MSSFQHPISNTQYPTGEGRIKPWNTVVTEHNPPVIPVSVLWLQAVPLGYWIFLVGYWIFCSKFLNLIAMSITLPNSHFGHLSAFPIRGRHMYAECYLLFLPYSDFCFINFKTLSAFFIFIIFNFQFSIFNFQFSIVHPYIVFLSTISSSTHWT